MKIKNVIRTHSNKQFNEGDKAIVIMKHKEDEDRGFKPLGHYRPSKVCRINHINHSPDFIVIDMSKDFESILEKIELDDIYDIEEYSESNVGVYT